MNTIEALARHAIAAGRDRRTEIRVEFGAAHEVIVAVAEEVPADLIVMGREGKQDLSLSARALTLGGHSRSHAPGAPPHDPRGDHPIP